MINWSAERNPDFDRIKRIRKVGDYPSGAEVLGALHAHLNQTAYAESRELRGSFFPVHDWLVCGAPLWWVDEETEADLIASDLPGEMTFSDMDWPFPAFALVMRSNIVIGSAPRDDRDSFMACRITPSVFGAASHLFSRARSRTLNYTNPEAEGGSATELRETLRLCVGAALLLATHPNTDAKTEFYPSGSGRGSSPIEKLRARLPVNPPWLHDAVGRDERRGAYGGGSHASPEAHWRRAHWRLQRVGKGRSDKRMVWVRHAMVGGAAQ
jgi:hypothetical protein